MPVYTHAAAARARHRLFRPDAQRGLRIVVNRLRRPEN